MTFCFKVNGFTTKSHNIHMTQLTTLILTIIPLITRHLKLYSEQRICSHPTLRECTSKRTRISSDKQHFWLFYRLFKRLFTRIFTRVILDTSVANHTIQEPLFSFWLLLTNRLQRNKTVSAQSTQVTQLDYGQKKKCWLFISFLLSSVIWATITTTTATRSNTEPSGDNDTIKESKGITFMNSSTFGNIIQYSTNSNKHRHSDLQCTI